MFEKLKKAWKNQPEVTLFKPFRIAEEPQPIPFEFNMHGKTFKGFILRQDPAKEPRELNKRGNSHSITVPPSFVKHLKTRHRPYLIQIENQIGLMVLPALENGETIWHQD